MTIELHPEKGVNPCMACCPRCGRDNGELLLIGRNEYKATCGGCGVTMFGYKSTQKCPKCGERNWQDRKQIGEYEKIPTSLCTECETELAEHATVVAAGGAYFRCSDCGVNGVLRASEGTHAARRQLNLDAPGADGKYPPMGVEFTKADCPKCGPNPVV